MSLLKPHNNTLIVVTANVDIGQWYCVVCGVYCGYSNSRNRAIVLLLCGDYCGYSNSKYRAKILSCGWSSLWLGQH